jgi:hypothetical protein
MTSRDHVYGILLFAAILAATASVAKPAFQRCQPMCTAQERP